MTRRCIIVSPYFPPSMLAGVHRARHLAKHLPGAGWAPVVVCVDEAYHEERLDPDLAALVPASVEIVRVPAVPAWVTRLFGVGEISLRGWWPLRRAVLRLLETRTVDAVFITGSPYFPMLLAAEIKRRFSVPVVLDFQDPWVSGWGALQPILSKQGLSHLLAAALEPRALRAADFITSVSEVQNAEMAARYPWISADRMAAIPIGGDPDDYAALRGLLLSDASLAPAEGLVVLSYVGTVWPGVIDTLRTLLRACARIRDRCPAVYRRMRLNFVGTTANPNDVSGFLVRPLAQAEGVNDVVHEVPQRLPYLHALSIQANSHGLILLGSHEPHYTASKLYGALMSGRPHLSIFHRDSSAHEILMKASGGVSLAFSSRAELAALESPIADALIEIATGPEKWSSADSGAYAPYEAALIARRFATIFEQLALERCHN